MYCAPSLVLRFSAAMEEGGRSSPGERANACRVRVGDGFLEVGDIVGGETETVDSISVAAVAAMPSWDLASIAPLSKIGHESLPLMRRFGRKGQTDGSKSKEYARDALVQAPRIYSFRPSFGCLSRG